MTWVHGRNNFKFGGGISAYQNNTVYDFIVNGEFDFDGSTSGNEFADFLLGAPIQYFRRLQLRPIFAASPLTPLSRTSGASLNACR